MIRRFQAVGRNGREEEVNSMTVEGKSFFLVGIKQRGGFEIGMQGREIRFWLLSLHPPQLPPISTPKEWRLARIKLLMRDGERGRQFLSCCGDARHSWRTVWRAVARSGCKMSRKEAINSSSSLRSSWDR
jgi:hypothetical protein